MQEYLNAVFIWYMDNINYYTITLLMTIESTFLPVPSELVVPPAAYKAAQGELNIFLVLFFSTFGAVLGTLINYYFARSVGRVVIYKFANTRFANLCLIEPASIQKAESFFVKRGNLSVLMGRLLPVIRHLISIPAGLAKMPIKSFILYSTIGSLLWNVLLAMLGYFLPEKTIETYLNEITLALVGLVVFLVVYAIGKRVSDIIPRG